MEKEVKAEKNIQRNSNCKIEIIAEDSPNLMKDINLQLQEGEQTSNMLNPKKFMPRHIIFKLLKTKGKE